MQWRPLHKRIIVFSVPLRQKIGMIYKPNERSGMLSRCEEVWVLTPANDCLSVWTRGTKCYISDGFELFDADLGLWDEYKDLPEFAGLRAFVDQCEGSVKTTIVAEGSILGVEDGNQETLAV